MCSKLPPRSSAGYSRPNHDPGHSSTMSYRLTREPRYLRWIGVWVLRWLGLHLVGVSESACFECRCEIGISNDAGDRPVLDNEHRGDSLGLGCGTGLRTPPTGALF